MTTLPNRHTGPGLVDLQLNGYAGFDFNGDPSEWTADELHRIRKMLARRGVAVALPTLITDTPEAMLARATRYALLVADDETLSRTFPKLHIEGPFISPEQGPRGAHPLAGCRTPRELPSFIEELCAVSQNRIAIVTLAPELPGAIELIEQLAASGICPAIGHTGASSEVLRAAVAAGARMSTHLGNGSHQVLPRLDNYIQAQLADDDLPASFIADGHHIPFFTLKSFLRAKGFERSVLVTDAISGADAAPGVCRLGAMEIEVSADRRTSKPGHFGLAGSVLTLDRAVIHVCLHCGVPFSEAWAMASTRPAELIGIEIPDPVTVAVHGEGFVADSPAR